MTALDTPLGFESPGVALAHIVTETVRFDRATVIGADPMPWRRSGRVFDPVMVEVKRSRTSDDVEGAWHVEYAQVSGHLDGGINGERAPVDRRFEAHSRHDWPAWVDEVVDYLAGAGELP